MKSFFNCLIMFLSKRIVNLILFNFIALNFLLATEGAGQKLHEINISVDFNDEKLSNVIDEIEEKTQFKFNYNLQTVRKKEKFSLKSENTNLRSLLEELASYYSLKFKRYGANIVVNESNIQKVEEVVVEEIVFLDVTGKVTDEQGVPLPGASVLEKDTNNGTTTNFDGEFTISVLNQESILVISYMGYISKEFKADEINGSVVSLEPETSNLDEVVLVGFASKEKKAITGAIEKLEGEDAAIAPIGNVSATLAGRIPGLVSVQSSGQPGFDNADLSIRGFGAPLVIVDGVESDFNTLDPNTIESFTVLKDAAASVYGARAGNGVILVTTKRGGKSKPAITINSAFTSQGVTTISKPVNAGQYAELLRESHLNQGGPEETAPYTLEEIEKFYDGGDLQYPNTSWYDVVFRKSAPQLNQNISVQGGNEAIKYYGFFGYLDQETIVKKGGSGYTRFNTVSNVDVKVTDHLSFKMNLRNTVEIKKYPIRGISANSNSAWEDFWNTQPIYPATLPDPTKPSYAEGSNTGGAHITTNRDLSGYVDTYVNNINGILDLEYKTDIGLTIGAFFNYNKTNTRTRRFSKPVYFYTYSHETGLYTLRGSLGSRASLNVGTQENRVMNGRISLAYSETFGKHQLDVLSLYQVEDYNNNWLEGGRVDFITPDIEELYGGNTQGMSANGSSSFSARKSWVNRLSYDFDKRYFIDFTLRADGSSEFPKESRWGYFPAVSVAWRLSEEEFAQSLSKLDELKIRLSYGEAGNDNVQGLRYQSGYTISSDNDDGISYLFGDTSYTGIVSLGLANPGLTWENIKTYNAGVDFSLFNRGLYGQVDVFYRERNGIIGSRLNNFPSTAGATLPPENLNNMDDRGFELSLGTSGSKGDFYWNISGNLSWSRAKWTYYEEPEYDDVDLQRINKNTGEWVDRIFGYRSDGLFTSQEEIDNLGYNQDGGEVPNSSLRPGDVKYLDINEDGIIDLKDRVDIGSTRPNWLVGTNINLNYKSFDLTGLFQGALKYNTLINFRPGSVFSETAYNERWTTENNNPNAIVPRVGGVNVTNSDYNIKSASYLRLKSAALGYTFPDIEGFDKIRIFVAGTNLLTFSKLNKYNLDPESPSGRGGLYYPQQRTMSLGLNLKF